MTTKHKIIIGDAREMNQCFSEFEKNEKDLFVVYDRFTFWEFFKILRKANYKSEQALQFVFANCSLSALVFQECINNGKL